MYMLPVMLTYVIHMGNIDIIYVSSYDYISSVAISLIAVIYIDGFIYSGVFSRVEEYEYEYSGIIPSLWEYGICT